MRAALVLREGTLGRKHVLIPAISRRNTTGYKNVTNRSRKRLFLVHSRYFSPPRDIDAIDL